MSLMNRLAETSCINAAEIHSFIRKLNKASNLILGLPNLAPSNYIITNKCATGQATLSTVVYSGGALTNLLLPLTQHRTIISHYLIMEKHMVTKVDWSSVHMYKTMQGDSGDPLS